MFQNIQNKENNEEMKEISQHNTIPSDEKFKELEEKMKYEHARMVITSVKITQLNKKIESLFKLLSDVSLRLDTIEKRIESISVESFLKRKNNKNKKVIVDLSLSDLDSDVEGSVYDLDGSTDSVRSESSEPNSEDIAVIVEDLSSEFSNDGSYCPDKDLEFEKTMGIYESAESLTVELKESTDTESAQAQSDVEMLSQTVANIDL